MVWFLYLFWPDSVSFIKATKALRRSSYLIVTAGVGHLLPILLLLAVLTASADDRGADGCQVAAVVAGASMIIGGLSQKAGVILKAGYLRAIVLGVPSNNMQSASPVAKPPPSAIHPRRGTE
jgi:hypothetical protein